MTRARKAMARLVTLFRRYVPDTGMADTVGGEIVRAVNRVAYRYYNDGDVCGYGWGRETVSPPARYLCRMVPGVDSVLGGLCARRDDPGLDLNAGYWYAGRLNDVAVIVDGYLADNAALFQAANDEDCLEDYAAEWDKIDWHEDADEE